jgi:hypothetical protein
MINKLETGLDSNNGYKMKCTQKDLFTYLRRPDPSTLYRIARFSPFGEDREIHTPGWHPGDRFIVKIVINIRG